jgi:hypothetical protein
MATISRCGFLIAPQFGQLLQIIRKRQNNVISLTSLFLFPLALVIDLVVCLGYDRDVRYGIAGDHLLFFELLHYTLFFSYLLLLYIQDCSEIIQKVAQFPISSKAVIMTILINTVSRLPTLALIGLSRMSIILSHMGPLLSKLHLLGLSLLLIAIVGYVAAALCRTLRQSPRVLGLIAATGILVVLVTSIPYLG